MKTLVIPEHEAGPHQNGYDGCHARWGAKVEGMCPGVENAKWLNGLGDDDEVYGTFGGQVVTNGKVRDNWINSHSGHVLAAHPHLAKLDAERRRLEAALRVTKRQIKQAKQHIEQDTPKRHNFLTDAVRSA